MNTMTDTEAMNLIAQIMTVPDWEPETLDEIANVVYATGRTTTEKGN